MIVANRHKSLLSQLMEGEILDINKTTIKMVGILKKILKPQGFNIGINIGKFAGAGIQNHLHVHIVPRWIGDTNFMPVLSNTKIISQSLKALAKAIEKVIKPLKTKAKRTK